MDLVGNDVDTLHEEIEHLVGHLVGNDVDTLHEEMNIYLVGNDVNTLHEEKNHLVGFSFIKVYRYRLDKFGFVFRTKNQKSVDKYFNTYKYLLIRKFNT
jgi:hypothetical protein